MFYVVHIPHGVVVRENKNPLLGAVGSLFARRGRRRSKLDCCDRRIHAFLEWCVGALLSALRWLGFGLPALVVEKAFVPRECSSGYLGASGFDFLAVYITFLSREARSGSCSTADYWHVATSPLRGKRV